MFTIPTFFYAVLGGIIPALFWLWFFLREDRKSPEPRSLIILAFIAGIISVFFVLPAEHFAEGLFSGTTLVIAWAAIEELFKYFAAAALVLWRKACDEPIDAIVYMITVALGFSAFENTLFLINPLIEGNIIDSILTGNLRFLGATLLHTLSSALIGIMIALAYYKRRSVKRMFLGIGIILAIGLHTTFNLFIMRNNGEQMLYAFLLVWIGIIALIFIFEKVKRVQKPFTSTFKPRRQHVKR